MQGNPKAQRIVDEAIARQLGKEPDAVSDGGRAGIMEFSAVLPDLDD